MATLTFEHKITQLLVNNHAILHTKPEQISHKSSQRAVNTVSEQTIDQLVNKL